MSSSSGATPRTTARCLDVFVIDDDPDVILYLEEFLRRSGHNVSSTSRPVEGLEALRRTRCQLLLLDMRMPEMNGLEVLKQLRSFDESLPVIMMTAFPSIESAVEAKRLGVLEYLPKPFDLANLRRLLESVARRSGA